MRLNRNASNWTELERNKINENWDILEGDFNEVVDRVSDKAFDKVVDSARINWGEPVDSFGDLPSGTDEGETRMARDTGKVYRFDGTNWIEIQEIDATAINEVDNRLNQKIDDNYDDVTSQLADEANKDIYQSIHPSRLLKPAILFVDDDARKELYTLLYPKLKELGVPLTSAVVTSRIDNNAEHVTSAQMKEMSDLVEFVSHTHTHINLQESTESVIREDLSKSRNWLLEKGYNADVIVYPFGIADFSARRIVAQYFKWGMLSDRGDGEINRTPIDSFGLQRAYIDHGAQYIIDRIDNIKSNPGLLIVGMHAHYPNFPDALDDLETVVNYARINDIDIINSRQAMAYWSNYMEVGTASNPITSGFVIDATGEIHGRTAGRYRRGSFQSTTSSMPITDFPFDATVNGYVSGANSIGFPNDKAGWLEVHRHRNDDYSYQTYMTYSDQTRFFRKWDNTNKVWGNWTDFLDNVKHPIIEWGKVQALNHSQLNGNFTGEYTVSSSLFQIGRIPVVVPNKLLPKGITFDCVIVNNGACVLRVSNVTDNTIEVGSVSWKFAAIDVTGDF